jgi:hypothetical protein
LAPYSSADTIAGEKMGKQVLTVLLTGKTLEGNWVVWRMTCKMYLDPSWKTYRHRGRTSTEKGEWFVNEQGKLCFVANTTRCRRVKRRDDGGYNLYDKEKQLVQTIEKIQDGGVYSLQ